MNVIAEILTENLADQIAAQGHDVAEKLILAIDAKMESYDFTLSLARSLVKGLKESSGADEPFSLAELE